MIKTEDIMKIFKISLITEQEIKAIKLRLTLAIIEDILLH